MPVFGLCLSSCFFLVAFSLLRAHVLGGYDTSSTFMVACSRLFFPSCVLRSRSARHAECAARAPPLTLSVIIHRGGPSGPVFCFCVCFFFLVFAALAVVVRGLHGGRTRRGGTQKATKMQQQRHRVRCGADPDCLSHEEKSHLCSAGRAKFFSPPI